MSEQGIKAEIQDLQQTIRSVLIQSAIRGAPTQVLRGLLDAEDNVKSAEDHLAGKPGFNVVHQASNGFSHAN